MNQQDRITKAAELFDEIKKLFPDDGASLVLHFIDFDNLPEGWEIEEIEDGEISFKKATRTKVMFDITLLS